MENNTMNYEAAMNNLENSIQDGLSNIPGIDTVADLPAINPTKKNDVASAILLGVAGAGTVAIAAWAVFGGIKLGKFIKAKAALKKAAAHNNDIDEDFEDDFMEDDIDAEDDGK